MAVELIRCIIDPMLVKPKCVWEAVVCYKIVNKQVQIVNILKNYCLSNTFWLYQQRVKYTPFQFFSNLLLIIFNRNTLQQALQSRPQRQHPNPVITTYFVMDWKCDNHHGGIITTYIHYCDNALEIGFSNPLYKVTATYPI